MIVLYNGGMKCSGKFKYDLAMIVVPDLFYDINSMNYREWTKEELSLLRDKEIKNYTKN